MYSTFTAKVEKKYSVFIVPVNSSTQIAFDNISKCEDAIIQVTDVEKSLFDGYFKSNNNGIMNLEDCLLTLSKSSSIDGIFYCSIIKVEEHLVVRFFECGAFDNFFSNMASVQIQNDHGPFMPYCIYNSKDVAVATKRHKNLYSSNRKGK